MNRIESVLLCSACFLLSSCFAAEDAAIDIPDGQGGLRVSLESSDPILAGMTGHILVSRHGADAVEADREFDPARGSRAFDVIYLEGGVYDVAAQIVDEEGHVVLEGEEPEVTVAPGVLTSVFIQLEPSGGVQVGVEYPDLGSRLVVNGEIPSFFDSEGVGVAYDWVAGTQRIAIDPADSRYFLVGFDSDGRDSRLILHTADQPSNLGVEWGVDITERIPVDDAASTAPVAMVEAGGFLYLLTTCLGGAHCPIKVWRSEDGMEWEYLSSFPIVIRRDRYLIRNCSMVVDNQFNLYCIGGDSENDIIGIVHAYSPDAETWSPLLPFDEDSIDFTANLGMYRYQPNNISPWNLRSRAVDGAFVFGGVYVVFVTASFVLDGVNRNFMYRYTSRDREQWSGPRLDSLDETLDVLGDPLGDAHPLDLYNPIIVMFQTNDGVEGIAAEWGTGRVLWLTEE